MITRKKFHTINELQEVQRIASHCPDDVGLHSPDSSIIIDAKSYIGFYALDFTQPVLLVSENAQFHEDVKDIGETLE